MSTGTASGTTTESKIRNRKKSARSIISEAKKRIKQQNDEHLLKSNEKFKKIISQIKSEAIQKSNIPQ